VVLPNQALLKKPVKRIPLNLNRSQSSYGQVVKQIILTVTRMQTVFLIARTNRALLPPAQLGRTLTNGAGSLSINYGQIEIWPRVDCGGKRPRRRTRKGYYDESNESSDMAIGLLVGLVGVCTGE
jgi:hypothetical protein